MQEADGELEIFQRFYDNKSFIIRIVTAGQKIKKNPGQKNSWNQINQFHEKNFFDQIPFFAISKMAKNQFLNWEEV